MTIINEDIHPDTDIVCTYQISTNCLESSIANDRNFDRVYDDIRKKTVIICHPCAKLLWSQGELVAVRSDHLLTRLNVTQYPYSFTPERTSSAISSC